MKRSPRVRITGPLTMHVDSIAGVLLAQGYTWLSARSQLELMAHVSRWLAANDLGAEAFTTVRVAEFLAARRDEGHTHLLSPRGLAPLLAHLRELGVIPAADVAVPVGAVDQLLADYARFLRRERGFTDSTVQRYVGFARRFVTEHVANDDGGAAHLQELSGHEITQFVVRECSGRAPGSAKCAVNRLRSLLRFLHVEGRAPDLVWAVPSGPSWRLTSLPKGVAPRQVVALLASCDRRTVSGRRDAGTGTPSRRSD